ncbi:MAG: right-handed parallel beta-helix repeat-containing protein [Arcicella sp.]|nr:right-handed parallel beta-helix repeat-containing protein [Arcicella sp.]
MQEQKKASTNAIRLSIHTTNKTTLSGDLASNDTPFIFTTNRGDNSNSVVKINGNNAVFDGFTVRGANSFTGSIFINNANATLKNCRVIDNGNDGLTIVGNNSTITNCSILGNNGSGIEISNSSPTIKKCLVANNGIGLEIYVDNATQQTTITNSTIASNGDYGIAVFTCGSHAHQTDIKTIIHNNQVRNRYWQWQCQQYYHK